MIVMSEIGYVNSGLDAWELGRLEEDDKVLGFYFIRFFYVLLFPLLKGLSNFSNLLLLKSFSNFSNLLYNADIQCAIHQELYIYIISGFSNLL